MEVVVSSAGQPPPIYTFFLLWTGTTLGPTAVLLTSKLRVIMTSVHSNTASIILGTYCATFSPSFSMACANSDSTSGSLAPAIFRYCGFIERQPKKSAEAHTVNKIQKKTKKNVSVNTFNKICPIFVSKSRKHTKRQQQTIKTFTSSFPAFVSQLIRCIAKKHEQQYAHIHNHKKAWIGMQP